MDDEKRKQLAMLLLGDDGVTVKRLDDPVSSYFADVADESKAKSLGYGATGMALSTLGGMLGPIGAGAGVGAGIPLIMNAFDHYNRGDRQNKAKEMWSKSKIK